MDVRNSFSTYIHDLQDSICRKLEQVDGEAHFEEDKWEREEGGGGITRVIQDGAVFEKGGVNTSMVHGKLPELMQERLNARHSDFFACGISLVLHPQNPFVPTVHANYRYFELYEENEIKDRWFGGGADLTPYYVFDEDAVHFHQTLKSNLDKFDASLYPTFKKECDNYFYNTHRNENRGVGGIFFDYLRSKDERELTRRFDMVTTLGDSFLEGYVPIVERRRDTEFSAENRWWQEVRRGRYVEFNLIHDRGTLFGLKTNGRIESILMSLPPRVRWVYDFEPQPDSREYQTLQSLKPKNWITE